jgi:hypothetical protein
MKRTQAIVRRSALSSFYQCAEKLGIFGFDLCEDRLEKSASSRDGFHRPAEPAVRMEVDFAVLDREAKDTVHAVLEQVHPDSIAIFELNESAPAADKPTGDARRRI